MSLKDSRKAGLFIVFVVYLIASVAGVYVFLYFEGLGFLQRILIADVAATVAVWIFSIVFKNSSVYDPYWSVAPIVILFGYSFYTGAAINRQTVLLLFVVLLWGVRLTANWAYTFKDLNHQDWRYDYFKDSFPKYWVVINFFGIHLMPTMVVYAALIPGLYFIENSHDINMFTYMAVSICVIAVLIQMSSDYRMHSFRKSKKYTKKKVCDTGLWGYCRHPNYFGEILMWWGVYAMLISVVPEYWYTGAGALLNTLLFLVVSIPLMEKRQLANKPEYGEYLKNTNKLIPFSRKVFDNNPLADIFKNHE